MPGVFGRLRIGLATAALLALGACGTRYALPTPVPGEIDRAAAAMAAAGQEALPPLSDEAVIGLFRAVTADVEPVAEAFCREQRADRDDPLFCDFDIGLWPDPEAEPNAYQTLGEDDRPLILFTVSFLRDLRNPDELAFVMGHEAGHQIADHLVKKRRQQVAGAVLMGVLTAAAYGAIGAGGADGAFSSADQQVIGGMMMTGAALGGVAYSQSYELEADHVGTYIAERAGYDPQRGALVFARLGAHPGRATPGGTAAFWSTHPNSPERLATVAATATAIERQRAAGLAPAPTPK